MHAQNRADALAILGFQIGLNITGRAQCAQPFDIDVLPAKTQPVELDLAFGIGDAGQQAERLVCIVPAGRQRAIGVQRVGPLLIAAIGIGRDEGVAIERVDEADINGRSDAAFHQVGGGRLDDDDAVDQGGGQHLKPELAAGLAGIANIFIIGERHAVEGHGLKVWAKTPYADELSFARFAHNGDARHALQRLGNVEGRQLANVGSDDCIRDRIRIALHVQRATDTVGKTCGDDDIATLRRYISRACRRLSGRRRLRAHDQRPRAILHDRQSGASGEPAQCGLRIIDARQGRRGAAGHGRAGEEDVLAALACKLFKRAIHRLRRDADLHAPIRLLGLAGGRDGDGAKGQGQRRRSAELPFEVDHAICPRSGAPRERLSSLVA